MGECAQLLLEQCALSGDVERLRMLADVAQWQQIGQLAIEDGVAGLMYWHCAKSELALPARVERQWQRLYRNCAGANLAALCRLEQVLVLFAERGIDALLLPGAPLLALYPDLGCRSMDDIDLLVHPDRLEEVAVALGEMGYRSPERHPDIFVSDELVLDIHVDLFHVERVEARRFAGSIPIEDVWQHHSKWEIGGFEFDCIDAEDAAIYSAVHVLRHSFRRLNWFVDLHLLCARKVNAEQLIGRVEAASFEKPMLYALRFLLPHVDLPTELVAWTRTQTMSGVETWFVRKAWADRHHNELGDVLWTFSIGGFVRRLYFILQTLFPRPAVLMQVFPFLPAPLFPLAYALRLIQLLLRGGRQFVNIVRKP